MNSRIHVIGAMFAVLGTACATLPEDEIGEESTEQSEEGVAAVALSSNETASKSEDSTRGVRQELGSSPKATNYALGGAQTYGICVRAAWGPGWVNWAMSNPSGSGFSVKPESTWNLVWASAPGQNCDGIYRQSWGCGSALKVPDSCTADVTTGGSVSCCCNAAMAALGHVCQWVNPGASNIGWPNCPL
jgi:hypothetical protein